MSAETAFGDVSDRLPKKSHTQDTNWVGDDHVYVNPEEYESSMVHDRAYASFDGFWTMLHEIFHNKGGPFVGKLTKLRNKHVVKLDNTAVAEVENRTNWTTDFPGQEAGAERSDLDKSFASMAIHDPHTDRTLNSSSFTNPGSVVSFVNVLRMAFGLPIRVEYGQAGNGDTRQVSFLDYSRASSTQAPEAFVGLSLGPRETLDQNMDMFENFAKNLRYRAKDEWNKKLENASISLLHGSQILDFEPEDANANEHSFDATMRNIAAPEEKLSIYVKWWDIRDIAEALMQDGRTQTNVPAPEMGPVRFELQSDLGGAYDSQFFFKGHGYFGVMNPFYFDLDGANFGDTGEFDGSWQASGFDISADTTQTDGMWFLKLGEPYVWSSLLGEGTALPIDETEDSTLGSLDALTEEYRSSAEH